ncbi:alpha/beta hydrolase [Pseudomonas batumici]|uniref:alpha/beta fold hydrolase n=1 Tax=Pseudomonas batumici TaxID=226910 RepID=UPI0030CBCB4D
MPFKTISGQPLYYRDEGKGFPVLLGHSYLWNSSMWEPQITVLSKKYRVIAPDLWGHGRSGKLPNDSWALSDIAHHMLRLLDELDIQQCAMVGLSVGGMWGAELALMAPERIRCLVLMDTYLGAEPPLARIGYFKMLEQIYDAGAISSILLDRIVPLFFHPEINLDSALPSVFRSELAQFSAKQLRENIVPLGQMTFGRKNKLQSLRELDSQSTLLMCGQHDIPRPPAETLEMAQRIGCEYKLIPKAGHISNLENPNFVNEALLAFIRKHALSPSCTTPS